MTRFAIRTAPMLLLLAMLSASCQPMAGGGTTGCGMPKECGEGTYWNGSQCASKDALCGEGTKYDQTLDSCVRSSG